VVAECDSGFIVSAILAERNSRWWTLWQEHVERRTFALSRVTVEAVTHVAQLRQ
jgi:hypothetical protein